MFIHQKNAKESDIIFYPKEGDMVNLNTFFNWPVAFLKQAKRALAEMKSRFMVILCFLSHIFEANVE